MERMKQRTEVYRAYWNFAAERQKIFFSRVSGLPRPWTEDPILAEFKFCNTFRASDRVSQFLIRHVIYGQSLSDEDTVFRILLFKIFNKIETWQFLERELGPISYTNFDYFKCANLLEKHRSLGNAIYSNAYMSCANKAFGFDAKHRNHLALIEQMNHRDNIAASLREAKSLEEVYLILRKYPLIGDFMAYQLAIDLNYSEVINFSENDFTVPGPGAIRGIAKCFEVPPFRNPADVIMWMVQNQDKEFARLGIDFKSLWGRPLHAIDCQGLFCETDKYSRQRFPEIASNRKRIKEKYKSTGSVIKFFYPPKWGINRHIENSTSDGDLFVLST